jgi:serine/threonine-protein kinase
MTTPPRRIGKFEILDRLGEGALSEVFLARDTILGREVALKTFRPSAFTVPDAQERFFREVQAAGGLSHPNLISVHEFGEDQGLLYLAMDYVPGQDLRELLEAGELKPKEVLELLAQVCDGLAFAHHRGVVHRALTPATIRVTRVAGRPTAKVLALGLARLAGDLPASAAYLAPESKSGKADHRADLYALGVILHQALAADSGDPGGEPLQLDLGHLESISPAIQGILAKATARNPAARYANAEAMATALRAARDPGWDPAATDRSASNHGPLSFEMPGRKAKVAVAPSGRIWPYFLIPLLLAGGGYGGWYGYHHHHRAAPIEQPPPAQPVPAPQPVPPPSMADTASQAPIPAPAPEPPKPPVKTGPGTLEEAAAAVASDPEGALAYLEPLATKEPHNERVMALRIAALYAKGDFKACGKAMYDARTSGHPLWPLAVKYPELRTVLEKERAEQRLPRRKAEPSSPGSPAAPGAARPRP